MCVNTQAVKRQLPPEIPGCPAASAHILQYGDKHAFLAFVARNSEESGIMTPAAVRAQAGDGSLLKLWEHDSTFTISAHIFAGIQKGVLVVSGLFVL